LSGEIRVVVADDQRVVREGLAMVLGLLPSVTVVGSAADGEEALALAAKLAPDVVLMDLRMPRCDGVEATRRLRERQPEVKVLVLTTYADDRSVIEALRAGARGYLTRTPAPRRSARRWPRSRAATPPSTPLCSTIWSMRSRPRAVQPSAMRPRRCPTTSRPARPRCSP
jgi:DNA-binding NarL/FixJ family response regulator